MEKSQMIGKKREGTLQIQYSYENDSGLVENEVAISIDSSTKEEDDWYGILESSSRMLSFEINHPNFLRCFGYDRLDDSTSCNAIYRKYPTSLREFIVNGPQMIQEFKVPSLSCAEDKKLTYNYIPDVYRQFFRDMIGFIIYLHNEKNLSLFELTLDRNLMVEDSVVKFCRLRFNESTTTESKNKDFKYLATVLEEVIESQQVSSQHKDKDKNKNKVIDSKPIARTDNDKNKRDGKPPDFLHLVECMKKCHESNGDQLHLINHLAVLRSGTRLQMIKNFSRMENSIPTKELRRYTKALETMGTNEMKKNIWEDWTLKLDGTHPAYELIKTCYDSSGPTTDSKSKRNKRLIDFCRNMAQHINSTDWKQYSRIDPFNEHEVEGIIMAAYAKQLLAFQTEAKKHGALKFLI